MKFIKTLTVSLLMAIMLWGCVASRGYRPRVISVNGNFTHKPTNVLFPDNWDHFRRESVTIFDKDSINIGVKYVLNSSQDLRISLYLYPIANGIEHRLRDEFLDCLQSIAIVENQVIHTAPKPVQVAKDGYKVIGLSGAMSDENNKTVLVLFECGKYFLKYRVSSNVIDTSMLVNVSKKLQEDFSPIDIVKKQPIRQRGADVNISPGITSDSACLVAIFAAVKAKTTWVINNCDSLERCAGFPNLYFVEQKTAIDSMLNKWERLKHTNSMFDKYFNDLLEIRKSGFLNEFICEEYLHTLLLPEKLQLNWDKYEIWKRRVNPTVKLVGQYYYLLGYNEAFKTEDKSKK